MIFTVSTKGRYALRLMLDLATQNSEKFVSLEEIATRQGFSKKYLESILKILVQNELLKGVRGKGGGYKLTRKLNDYTVGEILELTDGNLSIVPCLENENNLCERKSECLTLPMWEKFNKLTRDFFYGITLQDLLTRKL
jgi:Rrf2 family protein